MKFIPIKSMRRITDDYLKKKYPIFYEELYKIKMINISLSERVWLYKNELYIIPTCPNCGKDLIFKNLTVGYKKYCSKSCAATHSHKDIIIKEKRIKNMVNCNYDKVTRFIMTEKSNKTKSLFLDDRKKEIINKRKNTVQLKYGVDIISQNEEIKNKIIEKIIKTKENNKDNIFNNRIKKMGYSLITCDNNNLEIFCDECKHIFKIHRSLFNQRNRLNITVCTVCNTIDNHISDFQGRVKYFISSICDYEIIDNYTTEKYEIDIYIPELNLGFECNGLWWHSEKYKEKEYHINKLNYFTANKIEIMNIWEDDWKVKKEIVKSMILNKLVCVDNEIYSGGYEIKKIIDNKLVRNFLDTNHLHGFVKSKIKIGLYYNNELVSIMLFNNIISNDEEYEMLRFCSKLNNDIIGCESKLFKYFIDNYNATKIISYSDRCYNQDKLYKNLGFDVVGETDADFYYFHKDNGIRLNKNILRKNILVSQGYDKNKTVHEIMRDRNYYRIYDCGNLKLIYIK